MPEEELEELDAVLKEVIQVNVEAARRMYTTFTLNFQLGGMDYEEAITLYSLVSFEDGGKVKLYCRFGEERPFWKKEGTPYCEIEKMKYGRHTIGFIPGYRFSLKE
jgi:hypothetical protein